MNEIFDISVFEDDKILGWNFQNDDKFPEATLKYDLGHSVFSSIYSAVAISKSTNPTHFPKPPYIPEIKSISLNYTAEVIFNDENFNEDVCDLFNIAPFGNEKVKTKDFEIKDVDQDDELLIGIDHLDQSSVLSLYFRLGEANNQQREVNKYNYPEWCYLDGNSWKPFDAGNISDSTNHFTGSGIVCLNIPSGAFPTHTIMPDGKVWLKLVFKKDSDLFPVLEKVETQVVEASFVNQNNELSHLEKGVPAGTISKPKIPIQGIKSVTQPYPSYDGRGIEDRKTFYTRVSERLHHKGRAWNIWDYERLILEQFPELFKVKCIPNTKPDGSSSPGNVLIVLIPDCRVLPQRKKYQPVASLSLINDVGSFIRSCCSPFVNVHVINPEYEQIKVECGVKYSKECSDGADYNKLLNDDLKTFLAPWTSDSDHFDFNRTLSKAQIIYFMEKRPYVDYIGDIKVTMDDIPVKFHDTIQAGKINGIITTSDEHTITNIN